ncbi:MAG: phospholipid carrier-dependent glycosyltransferase [Spirulina sp. SIO3F2]|nr:phospholipid carrier-dependent glycosyltransferase [Spirulina sp. SIO3F2]
MFFWRNGALALWEQDEAAYAGFALRMVTTGDWVIPEFIGAALHQKPPLHFWAIATLYQQFGVSEFATRLPGSLAIFGMGVLLIVLGRGLWPLKMRAIAALICWSSLLLPVYAKIALTDGLLVFLSTLALLSWLQALRQPHWFWHGCLWLSVGLGLLTKGPPLLALVATSEIVLVICRFWSQRQTLCRGAMTRIQLIKTVSNPQDPGLVGNAHSTRVFSTVKPIVRPILQRWLLAPLAFVPLGMWIWYTLERDGGDYIRNFLDFYLFKRLAGSTFAGQTGPPGYYAAILAIAFLSWLPWLCCALVRLWQQRQKHPEIWAWLIAGWLGYELIPSKLPSYVLGAYPLLAILIAQQVQLSCPLKMWRWGVRSFGVLSLLFTAGLGGVAIWLQSVPLGITASIWFVGNVGLLWRWQIHESWFPRRVRRPRYGQGKQENQNCSAGILPATDQEIRKENNAHPAQLGFWQTTAQSLLLLSLIWVWVLPSWQFQHSAPKRLTQEAIAHLEPQQTLTLVGNPDLLSVPFYLEAQDQPYQVIADIFDVNCNDAVSNTLLVLPAIAEMPNIPHQTTVTGWFGQFGTSTTYWLIDRRDWCAAR